MPKRPELSLAATARTVERELEATKKAVGACPDDDWSGWHKRHAIAMNALSEELGLVRIDRGTARSEGYRVFAVREVPSESDGTRTESDRD